MLFHRNYCDDIVLCHLQFSHTVLHNYIVHSPFFMDFHSNLLWETKAGVIRIPFRCTITWICDWMITLYCTSSEIWMCKFSNELNQGYFLHWKESSKIPVIWLKNVLGKYKIPCLDFWNWLTQFVIVFSVDRLQHNIREVLLNWVGLRPIT